VDEERKPCTVRFAFTLVCSRCDGRECAHDAGPVNDNLGKELAPEDKSPDIDTTENPAVSATPDTHMSPYVNQLTNSGTLILRGTISHMRFRDAQMLRAFPAGLLAAGGKT
jgi:hypothetical protein